MTQQEIESQAREWLEQFPTVYQPSSDCGSFRSGAVMGFNITPKDVAKLIADASRSGYEKGVRDAVEKAPAMISHRLIFYAANRNPHPMNQFSVEEIIRTELLSLLDKPKEE